MIIEAGFIKDILPNHYRCHADYNGVYCFSEIGLDKTTQEWIHFEHTLKLKFGSRLIEIKKQDPQNKKFKVLLRP